MRNDETDLNAFENSLRRGLRRVNPPATLAVFLELAAEAEEQRAAKGRGPRLLRLSNGGRVIAFPRTQAWGLLAAGVMLVLLTGGTEGLHLHRERERARATHDFETATRITDAALQHTREQMLRAGVPLD